MRLASLLRTRLAAPHLVAAAAWGLLSLSWAAPLSLPPGVPVIVDPAEPAPVLRAAEDLCRDLKWVLGAPSPLLEPLPGDDPRPAIVVTCHGSGTKASRDASLSGSEAHAIFIRGNQAVLQGADSRGAIYAIYSFSDHFLDVPPWWVFAGWKPERRPAIELPRDTRLHWPSPRVRWRAWFPNDQDLLTPWIHADYEARWNLLAETMLRLKLNLVDIGELTEKSTRKAEIPRDRGLAITTTHLAPFGASLRNWESFWAAQGKAPAPSLSLSNVPALEQFWEAHIRLVLRKQLEMVWMIGFRGDGDKGFHRTFADAPASAAGRAAVVQDMIRRQVALLKRVTGQDHPTMRTVLYDECSDYMAAGLLQPPDEPSLIWNFANARRDHFPAADLLACRAPPGRLFGYYFNAQFTETGCHLADGEGPWKMEQNHRLARQAGSNLELSIINAGNVREFPLTLAAHAAMMWDFDGYDSARFGEAFCRRYWGPTGGPQAAQLYREFYAAYWQQRKPDLPGFDRQYLFQDLRLARATRELLKASGSNEESHSLLDDRGSGYYRIVPADSGAATKLEAVVAGCSKAAERFQSVADRCAELSPGLPTAGRAFFDQSLRMQAAFLAAACRCAVASAQAAQAVHAPEAYRNRVREAALAVSQMEEALSSAESGDFSTWYQPESIFKLGETRSMIDRRLKGMIPKAAPPKKSL